MRVVPQCLMWCIWSERNARCFEGCERPLLENKSFSYILSLFGVALCSIFLVFPFLFYLIIVIFGSWFLPPQSNVLGLAIFFLINFFVTYKKNHWIECLLWVVFLYIQFVIWLIIVTAWLIVLHPFVYIPYTWVTVFGINKIFIIYPKKKKLW